MKPLDADARPGARRLVAARPRRLPDASRSRPPGSRVAIGANNGVTILDHQDGAAGRVGTRWDRPGSLLARRRGPRASSSAVTIGVSASAQGDEFTTVGSGWLHHLRRQLPPAAVLRMVWLSCTRRPTCCLVYPTDGQRFQGAADAGDRPPFQVVADVGHDRL